MEIPIMAYFAELDENNIVLRVVGIVDQVCLYENGVEQEQLGINRCLEIFQSGVWKQTSYNTYGGVHRAGKTPLRKNFAGIGFTFDPQRDAFIDQQPEGVGWVLDEETCLWRNPEQEAQAAEREAVAQQLNTGITRV
jgi:hypothetical protein